MITAKTNNPENGSNFGNLKNMMEKGRARSPHGRKRCSHGSVEQVLSARVDVTKNGEGCQAVKPVTAP